MKRLKRDTSSILIISDMHVPFHHQDMIPFLKAVKDKYNPSWTVCIGDEVDLHGLSYHEKNVDLPGAGDELKAAIKELKKVYKLFPECDVLYSNHGSLLNRKAMTHGIPAAMLRTQRDILEAPQTWNWHFEIFAKLPTGYDVYFHHSKGANVLTNAQLMGCSFVQGHHHQSFNINYYSTPTGLHFGMTVGCLVNQKSSAFAYAKNNAKRFIIGVGVILNGVPELVPMILNSNGRWIGRL